MSAKARTAKSPPESVLVEVRGLGTATPEGARALIKNLGVTGCTVDMEYQPVSMGGGATHVIRCLVRGQTVVEQLKRHPQVVAVWKDTPIAPMS